VTVPVRTREASPRPARAALKRRKPPLIPQSPPAIGRKPTTLR
jgi:hypothetical protein